MTDLHYFPHDNSIHEFAIHAETRYVIDRLFERFEQLSMGEGVTERIPILIDTMQIKWLPVHYFRKKMMQLNEQHFNRAYFHLAFVYPAGQEVVYTSLSIDLNQLETGDYVEIFAENRGLAIKSLLR